jgi:hypothetical protein
MLLIFCIDETSILRKVLFQLLRRLNYINTAYPSLLHEIRYLNENFRSMQL